MSSLKFPNKFWYKQSHFEGNRTSYSWQSSDSDIVKETNNFFILDNGKKLKKENISFAEVNFFGERVNEDKN